MASIRLNNLSRRDFGRLSMAALGSAALTGTSLAGNTEKTRMTTMNGTQIGGTVAPGFERVKDAFAANFEKHGEVGAAFSLYHRGEKVVDLWGGIADVATGRPWAEDSIQLVASTTKGATAICANLLAQRGELDMDAPVARYWPEFAAAGKQNVPVRWLLSHRVGLPVFAEPMTVEEFMSWDVPVQRLAVQRPMWEPGTAHGYHAGTYGWLVGEVVRRVSGKTLGTFFADEVAGPLGLDFWIGLPESEESRVSPIIGIDLQSSEIDGQVLTENRRKLLEMARTPNSYLSRPTTTGSLDMNTRQFHAIEMPAGNGITDARSLARMYAALIGDGVDGVRLFTDETVERVSTNQATDSEEIDQVIGLPTRFGLGFALHHDKLSLGEASAFGHSGAGGSLGFADPKADLGFGYVMNKMQMVAMDDPRTLTLIEAAHQSLKSRKV